jgi:hypothetical protein
LLIAHVADAMWPKERKRFEDWLAIVRRRRSTAALCLLTRVFAPRICRSNLGLAASGETVVLDLAEIRRHIGFHCPAVYGGRSSIGARRLRER